MSSDKEEKPIIFYGTATSDDDKQFCNDLVKEALSMQSNPGWIKLTEETQAHDTIHEILKSSESKTHESMKEQFERFFKKFQEYKAPSFPFQIMKEQHQLDFDNIISEYNGKAKFELIQTINDGVDVTILKYLVTYK
jgi:hypothetical protein